MAHKHPKLSKSRNPNQAEVSEIENERFPADWATSKHAFAGPWQLTEVKVVHLKVNQGQRDELFNRICTLCCLHKWDADTSWPPRRVVGAWAGKNRRPRSQHPAALQRRHESQRKNSITTFGDLRTSVLHPYFGTRWSVYLLSFCPYVIPGTQAQSPVTCRG